MTKEKEMFCSKCGKENSNDAKFCQGCGAALNSSPSAEEPRESEKNEENEKEENSNTKQSYLKYCEQVKKINLFTLISQILTVLMILLFIFLPIYRCEYEPDYEELRDFSMEELAEAAANGGRFEKNFSLFDDMVKMIKYFVEESSPEKTSFLFLAAIFPLFEIIFSIILLCTTIPKIYGAISGSKNIEKETMLKYNSMRLTGSKQSKQNFLKQNTVITILLYALFDVVFSSIFANMPSSFYNSPRYMDGIVGLSVWSIFIILMVIGYIVVQTLKKKEEKNMLIKITEEQYS